MKKLNKKLDHMWFDQHLIDIIIFNNKLNALYIQTSIIDDTFVRLFKLIETNYSVQKIWLICLEFSNDDIFTCIPNMLKNNMCLKLFKISCYQAPSDNNICELFAALPDNKSLHKLQLNYDDEYNFIFGSNHGDSDVKLIKTNYTLTNLEKLDCNDICHRHNKINEYLSRNKEIKSKYRFTRMKHTREEC